MGNWYPPYDMPKGPEEPCVSGLLVLRLKVSHCSCTGINRKIQEGVNRGFVAWEGVYLSE